jgi:HD superfamily phosphohydrolase
LRNSQATNRQVVCVVSNVIVEASMSESDEGQPSLLPQKTGETTTPKRSIPARKLYQDEVYGTKELSPLAVAVVDTPEFQRLGTIHQLGFTHTVFRGANHHRLDHSVGTYFVIRTLMRRIVQNHTRLFNTDREAFSHPGLLISPRYFAPAGAVPPAYQPRVRGPMGRWRGLTELVSVAGLLHDLGHVPVGHTLEDEFTILQKHDSLGGSRLFEMLYGPRNSVESGLVFSDDRPPSVEDHFSAIRAELLPSPQPWERVPLPWVFEPKTYVPFFSPFIVPGETDEQVPPLSNVELRDLVYLTLSFKETVHRSTHGQFVHTTFEEELAKARSAAVTVGARARLAFVDRLWRYYSRPVSLGPRYEALPLFHPFISDVVGNTICADLLDYLVRDGKRLKLDTRDNPRIQRYLVIRPATSNAIPDVDDFSIPPGLRLTISAVSPTGLRRRDTVSELLDLMRERYRFAEVVYYHPKKAAFSTMLAKAVEILRGVEPDILRDDEGIYPAPWSVGIAESSLATPAAVVAPLPTPHIAHFGDQALIAYLWERARQVSPAAAALLRGITYRNEHMLLFTLDHEGSCADGSAGPKNIIDYLRKDRDKGRRDMEGLLAELTRKSTAAGLAEDDSPVLIYCPTVRMQAKEVAAHVELNTDKIMPLNRYTEDPIYAEVCAITDKYPELWRLYLFVHPKLLLSPMAQRERDLLLSAVVDTFCAPFRVPEEQRESGSKPFRYLRFGIRLDDLNGRMRQRLRYLPDTHLRRVRALLEDTHFWRHLLKRGHGSVPICDREFESGFAVAVTQVAADDADTRQRMGWRESLQAFLGPQWYRHSSVPATEEERTKANLDMQEIAATLLSTTISARSRPTSWEALVQQVASRLSVRQ